MTKETQWIDCPYTPCWVKNMLAIKPKASTGQARDCGLFEEFGKARFKSVVNVRASKAQELPAKSGWETLSLEEALTSIERLPERPSIQNLTFILHRCRTKKDLAYTKRLYGYICENGLEDHRSVGNYLVQMLVQVGSMCDAQQVFNKLDDRNENSWTSLIRGYIECGDPNRAINLYQKMQEDSIHPSEYTFVALLKACARLKDAKRGRAIHAEVARKGLEREISVGNTLVDMYAKGGLLAEAQEAFDKMPMKDEVSWNVLIAGYAKHGLGDEAMSCLEQMQLKGLSPNAVTFACSLKACGSIGVIDKAREVHAKIFKKGLDKDLVVGCTLVDMYVKCGSLAQAREVFEKLPVRNEVSWNVLIAGYAKHGLGEEAVKCLERMQLESISPNAVTFVCILKACGSIGAIDKGREIHSEIARKELERQLSVCNTLVDMYAKCDSLIEAEEAFDKLPARNVVSWTALMAVYAKHGLGEEALNCLEEMQLEGLSPDAVTLVSSLKACGSIGARGKGREIHADIARKGLEIDVVVGNILVDMYAKCGSLAEAQEAFDKLPLQDTVSWNSLMAGYAEEGLGEEVLNWFKQMKLEGLSPDALTFVCSLKASGSIGAIDKGREIHSEISRKGLERYLSVYNTLVDLYTKCGSLEEAREAFDKLPVQDIVSWTALITGYAQQGESDAVFHMFERMRGEGVNPNGVTLSMVLTVCSHTGLVDKGQMYFEAMSKDYGITPSIKHHVGMVDLLGRAGQLDKAIAMVKNMPFQPNLVVWHAILGACQKAGTVELGRVAFEHAVQLDENAAASFVLMSNIYTDAHMDDEEMVVEAMRLKKQGWKNPGDSWTY